MELRHLKGYLSVRFISPHDSEEVRSVSISITGPRGGRWGSVSIRPEDAPALAEALRSKHSLELGPAQYHSSSTLLSWVGDEALLLSRSGDFREWEGATLDAMQAEELAEAVSPSEEGDSSLAELIQS